MSLRFFLTHPGLDIMDDAHAYSGDGQAVGYESLMQELGSAARTVVMNYPPELLKRGLRDAQVLSFAQRPGVTVAARVYLGLEDSLGRQVPVTEIFMGEHLSWQELTTFQPVLGPAIKRPAWPSRVRTELFASSTHLMSKVADWDAEWRGAFAEAVGAFRNGHPGPWVSMCFDRVQYEAFGSGRLYTSKIKLNERRGALLVGLGVLLAIAMVALVLAKI